MNNLHNNILVYHLCNKYLILPIKFFDFLILKISNPLILKDEINQNLKDKILFIFNWENFSNEFKLKCTDAEKIIIFSDTLKSTVFFEPEKKLNKILCRLCLEENTWNKTICCKQELHINCYSNWKKSCPFCRFENYYTDLI